MRTTSLMLAVVLLVGGAPFALGCPSASTARQAKACCCHPSESEGERVRVEVACCCLQTDDPRAPQSVSPAQESRSREIAAYGLCVGTPALLPPSGGEVRVHPLDEHSGLPPPTLVRLHALLLC